MKRRDVLRGMIGCSLAASPLVTPMSFAASPALGDNRLVVIVLRGAMDGLDVVQPYGDPDLRGLRDRISVGPDKGALDLDGFFALHPRLETLMPLWKVGELGFAHAVSTPYRERRSHFDGQDLLEAGVASLQGKPRDGWMNRMLQNMPGVVSETAYSIGQDRMFMMHGDAKVSDWSPDLGVNMTPQGQRLLDLVMHDDPLFQAASAEAMEILASLESGASGGVPEDGMMMEGMEMMAPAKEGSTGRVADFAASRLRGDTRIAAFSIGGWDTHSNQRRGINRALDQLAGTLLRLRQGVGRDVWGKTAVVAMTEFGRTARENGTAGTDHGTGGMALFAGGAIRGGRVLGDWPGLAEVDLYARRDLMPTRDVRAYAAWAIRGLYGLDKTIIENAVFPGLEMGMDPGLIA
ncbi:MAG: DUF1501 domain-containing protein [Planktomarina sp.]